MEITVYKRLDGGYIMVPDCFLPSMECRQRHGYLRKCGQVSVADAECARSWRQIVADIYHQSYAPVDAGEALLLLGAGHACLQAGASLHVRHTA